MPDNARFYHAAYTIIVVFYSGYALSLWLRTRRIRRRLAELDGASSTGARR